MFYQWGRKDSFTFATSSEIRNEDGQTGKHPVKIYTIDGVLIYQESNGGNSKDKQPAGGIIHSSTLATSMMGTIKTPNTFYGASGAVISQSGHTRDLWDYYWTSYSRGTDGGWNNMKMHTIYLNKYISLRIKSIYDPCPFGFKIPSNGTWNQFITSKWIDFSYLAGVSLKLNNQTSWFLGLGLRSSTSAFFISVGNTGYYYSNIVSGTISAYSMRFSTTGKSCNLNDYGQSQCFPVRCIEDLFLQRTSVRPDRWTRSIWQWWFLYQ